jgi:2-C-methyl-D-erythritol 4-phosphate cytidylyltransferase
MGDVWAIVLGGGSGARFGGAKQFEDLGGQTLLGRSVAAAASVSDGVVVVVPGGVTPPGLPEMAANLVVAPGGAHRAASVRSGLAAGDRVARAANFLLDSESRLRNAAASAVHKHQDH